MALEKGSKSSEFWFLVVIALVALAVATGWLTPAKMQGAAARLQETAGVVPDLIAAGRELVTSLAPLAGLMGLAWAYIKRRSELKGKDLEARIAEIKARTEAARIASVERIDARRIGSAK